VEKLETVFAPSGSVCRDGFYGLSGCMQVAIFLCNDKTWSECLEKNLFGTSSAYGKTVRKGDFLLLYNTTKRMLCGVWKAVSDNKTFDSQAWGGGFPNQVRVSLASSGMACLPKHCFQGLLGAESGWGKGVTGTRAHNLLQYFAFEYLGTMGLGVPLQQHEKDYRAQHPANFVCQDGHKVRFREEQVIDECLARWNIPHAYEFVLAFPPAQLVATFVVHRSDSEPVFIECRHAAADAVTDARSEQKRSIYANHGLRMIEISGADLNNLERTLVGKLEALGVRPANG
jgi:Development and cell death domain